MNGSFVELTGFQRDVLAATRIVEQGDSRAIGKTVRHLLEEQGYEEIKSGRFYPTLDTLVERGLLEKRTDPEDERANRYSVTEAGQDVVEDQRAFLDQLEDSPKNGSEVVEA
ncbi:MAG: PadR family transcriptional regulator [Halodesulfurarchaeum sp.]